MKYIVFLATIFGSFSCFSQDEVDESDSLFFKSSSINSIFQFDDDNYYSLDGFQHYRDFSDRVINARMGNIGLGFNYLDSVILINNIRSINGAYQPYLITSENLKFYNSSRPYSSLRYITGSKKEQYFSAFHTQNFGKRLNMSFQYDRITSEGFFAQQLTSHTRFHTNYNYSSYNGQFTSAGYFVINTLEALENGGVFINNEDNPDNNTILLDINLIGAQNRTGTQELGFINEFNFIKSKDTTNLKNEVLVGHHISWNKSDRNYADNEGSSNEYFLNNYLDSTLTKDSTYGETFSNELFLKGFNSKLKLGFKNSQFLFFQNFLIDETFASNYMLLSYNDSLGKLKFKLDIDKGISGYFKDDMNSELYLGYLIRNNYQVNLYAGLLIQRANPLMEGQRTNHYIFNTTLDNQEKKTIQLDVKNDEWRIGLKFNYSIYSNYYYLNKVSTPVNYNEDISIAKLSLAKEFLFWKNLHLNNTIVFQAATVDSIIPVPKLMSSHSLYYENLFFKRTLLMQIGIDYLFIDTFRGLNYNPSLAQYSKSSEGTTLGVINQIDVFLNMRINKSAKIFIKMENILLPSFSELSYRVNNYPIPGRAIKIGIFWRMLN